MSGRDWRGKRVSGMTDAEIRQMAGAAPGVVKVRLAGERGDVEMVAALLADYDWCGLEVIERSAPYANRRESGERVYLTLRVTEGGSR